jgi:hypothetical protein
MTEALQFSLKLTIIVDFAVEADVQIAGDIGHGLVAP